MISAGYLNDRIQVLTPVYQGRDQFGAQLIQWIKSAPYYCHVKRDRGQMAQLAGEVWLTGTIYVTMRYPSVITERCRLSWEGKTYQIENIDPDRSNGTIIIRATRTDEGSETFSE